MRRTVLLLAMAAILCAAGCSARRCGDLPKVDYKEITPPDPKPSIYFNVRYPPFDDSTPQAV
ncbi:MAG: hypothetical protein NT049_01140, partial [Planctomycetota bacterium]|nr:hypothetical protein [Planctomycetota bacterium]